jgi:hypothetical protein
VVLLDPQDKPAANVQFELTFPDGTKQTGKTGADGLIKFENLTQKGQCKLILPDFEAGNAS